MLIYIWTYRDMHANLWFAKTKIIDCLYGCRMRRFSFRESVCCRLAVVSDGRYAGRKRSPMNY